jgi:hypothetical protein
MALVGLQKISPFLRERAPQFLDFDEYISPFHRLVMKTATTRSDSDRFHRESFYNSHTKNRAKRFISEKKVRIFSDSRQPPFPATHNSMLYRGYQLPEK